MKQYLAPLGWALGMLVLILDGKTAMAGASAGVELCIRTLIPNLFPFFVLSMMLTSSLSGSSLLLTGICGGYPVGAANVYRVYKSGGLTDEEAERMVVLCNCAGPSFLFGVVGPVLGEFRSVLLLWGVYMLSIAALRMIFPISRPARGSCRSLRLQQALTESIRAMAGVCGWVVLFRVMITVADRWILWIVPDWMRVCIYGLLELSNGCLSLTALNPGLRFVLAAGFVGFGGFCVFLQTASVTQGFHLRLYLRGKLFQAALCMLLASLLTPGTLKPGVQVLLAVLSAFGGCTLRKSEKRCGNPAAVIV